MTVVGGGARVDTAAADDLAGGSDAAVVLAVLCVAFAVFEVGADSSCASRSSA